VPDVAGAAGLPPSGPALLRNVLRFGRDLRDEGLAADLATVIDYVRALELVDIGDREEVRAAGAALFVRRRDEIEIYDRIFASFWRREARRRRIEVQPPPPAGVPGQERPAGSGQRPDEIDTSESEHRPGDQEAAGFTASPTAWSPSESLRTRSFERMTADELRQAERVIDAMVPRLQLRRTRRWELHRQGTVAAPRQMLRRNLGTGGDPLTWLWRRPTRRPRSVVVLCDISGSMERHARLLLRFSHALACSHVPTEVFCFGTRLTRVTQQLRDRDSDTALARAAAAVGDWSGGTRIGATFREFNQRWARRVLRTSGMVIVVSDGWDRGDPAILRAESARLGRNCHRLIWLNPLAAGVGYQPLAQGMAAAYPSIDVFLPADDLASLEQLGRLLASGAGNAPRRPPARARAKAGESR
jgi:uncharacterized protein with von Willebrand factor type A (vWA) domain